jgi:hypothetical protein
VRYCFKKFLGQRVGEAREEVTNMPSFEEVQVGSRRFKESSRSDESGLLTRRSSGAGRVLAALGVGAVSLNVTVTEPDGAGYVTVYPCGTKPLASSLNYVAGQTIPNAVIAPALAQGEVCFYSTQQTHILADVNGWFSN